MIVKIVTGIRTHFADRVPEWAMGFIALIWGLSVSAPDTAFGNTEAWAGLLRIMPEDAWGLLCVAIGTARIAALAINGTFYQTAYSRYSPHVRAASAMLGAFVWLQVWLSVSVTPNPGRGIYLLPLALEIYSVFHAMRDTGRGSAARTAKAPKDDTY